jgi:hypothetical protein
MSKQHTAAAGATDSRSKKRKLTKEELAAISRANGAKSRGATSATGAARARRGNYKHGLACAILPQATEDVAAVAQTVHNWYDYYRPNSPIAYTLVKMCAQSDVMLSRCYTFLETVIGGHGKEVLHAWQQSRRDFVDEAVALLPTEPVQAVAMLRRRSDGCQWLREQWTGCQDGLLRYGYWPMKMWPEVVRLTGADCDLDRIGAREESFWMALYNFQCQPVPARGQIVALCAPERRPAGLGHLRLPEALPGPEECRQRLCGMVAKTIDELCRLEAELRMSNDRADLEFVLKKTLVPHDCESSRQFLRYHKEWGSLFFRASRVLPLALQRDASGFFDDLGAAYEDEPPPEPEPEPPAPGDPEPGSHADGDSGPGRAPADKGHAPAPEATPPAAPAAEAVAQCEAVGEESLRSDHAGGALPASADATVGEAAAAPERVGFPDPPSSALPAAAERAVAEAGGAPDRVGFPDPPSSRPVLATQAEDNNNSRVMPHDPGADEAGPPGQPGPSAPEVRPPERQASAVIAPLPARRGQEQDGAVRSIPDGLRLPATPVLPERAPPTVRGAPPSCDSGPIGGSVTPRGP